LLKSLIQMTAYVLIIFRNQTESILNANDWLAADRERLPEVLESFDAENQPL
jgi:hypothetical protein